MSRPATVVIQAATLAQTTLARSSLVAAPGKTLFAFAKPVYVQAGKRYAFVVITPGNHFIATTTGPSFNQGMFFGVTGGYGIADPTKHILADIYACRFRQTVCPIDFVGLQLAGGITAIDILAGSIAPSSTNITFQVQLAGVWTSLNEVNVGNLNAGGALPPLLPFRAVFTGTPDVMPVLDLINSSGDRVLVKNQSTAAQNGIYLVSAAAWTRTADFDAWCELPGAFTFVEGGTTQADTGWVCTASAGGTLGTTSVGFAQFSSSGSYLAGNGLSLAGNSFSVTPDGTSLSVSATGVRINASWTGQNTITTLGTIATGVWNGSAVGVAYGGTGVTTLSGLVKGNGAAAFTAAVAGTDYLAPSSIIDGGTF